ncbi:MAG: hypothetical protein Q9159_006732 [Coniocarpon cinnabarinum]
MAEAGTNFNHTIQHQRNEGHTLVTSGIYAWFRHPSYFGFFCWGLGTQIVLGNVICLTAYTFVLWAFFNHRISQEESLLVEFFGREYVILSASATFFLAQWHVVRVSQYRRRAQIPYPLHYAPTTGASATSPDTATEKAAKEKDAYLFNCAQRAHGNYNENHPTMVAALLLAGLRYPLTASAFGAAWSFFRVIYMYGYTMETKTKGEGRLYGALWEALHVILMGMSVWTGWKMLFP